MKYIKHLTDSHSNDKMRLILRKHGLEGIAVCWICRELVAKDGERYRIKAEKDWKTTLVEITKLTTERIDEMLAYQAEVKAISIKALQDGDLYIPKLREYTDEYTKQLRREYEAKELGITGERIKMIIMHYVKAQGWNGNVQNNPALLGDIFKRNTKRVKELIFLVKDDEVIFKAISKMAGDYNTKGISWTLETVIKHLADLTKDSDIPESLQKWTKK